MMRWTLSIQAVLGAALVLFAPAQAHAANPSTTECLTAADSSIQLRDQHKLRAARAQMLVCASPSCPAAVQAECLHRVDQVNAALPTVVFEPKDAGGNDIASVKVAMDGQPLSDQLDGSALAVDPGEHKFTFTAPGNLIVDKTLVIHEGEKDRREIVQMGQVGAPAGVGNAAGGAQGQAGTAPTGEAEGPNTGSSRRMIGLVVGGVGVAGIAVGSIFGILANSAYSSQKSDCNTSNCTIAAYNQALSDHSTASTDATVSTIAFIAGAAALGTGAVLFFTAPRGEASRSAARWYLAPTASSTAVGLNLGGVL